MTVQENTHPSSLAEQLSDLLLRWQELRQRGQNPAVEEIAASHPELVEQLERQIHAIESMEAVLGLAGETAGVKGESNATLPPIPGYDLLDVLDHGGMGIVYKARQVALKRVVALKMILAGPHAEAERLARFRSEAEAVAELQHPNIVQIYEVGEFQGQPFFSMEFVKGGNLAQQLGGKVLPALPAAQLVQTLAEAMAAAHQRGIIHRDLKPANILLQKDEGGSMKDEKEPNPSSFILHPSSFIPKITDFGLVKRLREWAGGNGNRQITDDRGAPPTWTLPISPPPTQTGAVLGTASYMAPEQAEGKTREIGPLVDVYALGAILYELLTGRPPFQGETTLDTLMQVRLQDPVAPRRLQPKVPRDLETICLKCLQKEPRKRYPSARALAQDLRRFLAGESIQARPTPIWEKGSKWAKRRPALAALLAVSAAAVAALLIGWIWFTSELASQRNNAVQQQQRALAQEKIAKDQQHRAEEEHAAAQVLLDRACSAVGEFAQAVQEAKLVARINEDPGSLLYGLARFYALASAARGGDQELRRAARGQLAQQYALYAVEFLTRARESGYFRSSSRIAKLRNDSDFEALRNRQDFQTLLRQLAGK